MIKIGLTIRELRLSKNVTLSEAAEEIVSVPFLSKFERGFNDISVTKFLKLLDRINVRLNEFELIYLVEKNKNDSQAAFLRHLKDALVQENMYVLNDLVEKELNYFEKDNNIRHKHNIILVHEYMNRINKLPANKNDIRTISNYLNKVEDWGYYELVLFSNSLYFFSSETINFFSKTAFKKSSIYSELNGNRHELSLTIINIITILIERNETTSLAMLFSLSDQLLSNTKHYYEINKLTFLRGLYLIKRGEEEGKEKAENAINIMHQMGQHSLAKAHSKKLNEILSAFNK